MEQPQEDMKQLVEQFMNGLAELAGIPWDSEYQVEPQATETAV